MIGFVWVGLAGFWQGKFEIIGGSFGAAAVGRNQYALLGFGGVADVVYCFTDIQLRVFTAKCSEPQVGISNGMDGGSGVAKFLSLCTETW